MIKIPNKSHFKANEVCTLTGVKPYVLRFWEAEFIEISPLTSSSGQKLFEHKDIEAILLVKKLLFEDKLTIEKAKFEIQRLETAKSHSLESDAPREESDDSLNGSELPPEFSSSMTIRSLENNDIQKLIAAKTKLNHMLDMTQGLQDRFNWS